MSQNKFVLNNQLVITFLLGLIAGAVLIGLFDANAKKPLFSSANYVSPRYYDMEQECDSYSGDTALCWRNAYLELLGH